MSVYVQCQSSNSKDFFKMKIHMLQIRQGKLIEKYETYKQSTTPLKNIINAKFSTKQHNSII